MFRRIRRDLAGYFHRRVQNQNRPDGFVYPHAAQVRISKTTDLRQKRNGVTCLLRYLQQTACLYVIDEAADSVISRDERTRLDLTDALTKILFKIRKIVIAATTTISALTTTTIATAPTTHLPLLLGRCSYYYSEHVLGKDMCYDLGRPPLRARLAS